VFVAGGDVYGKIEIESRADTELGLRCIFVELNAVERAHQITLAIEPFGAHLFPGHRAHFQVSCSNIPIH
jgi:hypothetical protein